MLGILKAKLIFVFAALLLLINALTPLAYAQEALTQPDSSSTVTDTTQQTPTPTTTPTPTPDQSNLSPTPPNDTTPTPTPTPDSTTPTPTPTPDQSTPAITPTPTLSSNNASASPSETPTPTPQSLWQINNDGSETIPTVQLNTLYTAPQDSSVTVTFDKLPDNPGSLTIKEVSTTTLSGINALTQTAYDISSNMTNGTFDYTLTLPTPRSQNVEVQTSEDGKNFTTVGGVTPSGNTLTINGLNHFSIFVVTNNSSDTLCVGAGTNCFSSIQTAINNATSGDTINIEDGTYTGPLVITTPNLTISGTTETGTIIDTSATNGYGIHILANGVTLKNLTEIGPQVASYSTDYGIKIEGSTGITLNNVTVQNAKKTGIDLNGVNSSSFTNITVKNNGANGFALTDSNNDTINTITTSGNAWGGIAVYVKGAFYTGGSTGVTISGDNSNETASVYTGIDGPYTITGLSVDQTALPYKVTLGNTDPQDIYVRDLATAATVASANASLHPILHTVSDNSLLVEPGFKIQDAINAASSGNTINVTAETYTEQLSINKSLTLKGAGSDTAIIQAPSVLATDTIISDTSDQKKNIIDVFGGATLTMSGFTVEGPGSSSCDSIDTGIAVLDGATLNLTTSTIKDVRDNPFSGCQNGEGIRVGTPRYGNTPSVGHATIDGVTVEDYQKNGIVIAGSGSTAVITNNTIIGVGPTSSIAQNGIQINGASATVIGNNVSGNECNAGSCGPDFTTQDQAVGLYFISAQTGTLANGNSSQSNDLGSYVDTVFPLNNNLFSLNRYENMENESGSLIDATNNDWGVYTTSGIASTIVSTNPAQNPVNFTPFLGANTAILAPSTTLDATKSSVFVDPSNMSGTSTITVPQTVTSPTIDLSSVTNGVSAALTGNVQINTTTNAGTIDVTIPTGTIFTGASTWNGTLNAPTILGTSTITLPPTSGFTQSVSSVIEIGDGDAALTFNNAVRIVLAGQAGMLTGYSRNGVFTPITTTCSADTQTAGNLLPAGGDCSINSGSDLVIWTKHFTKFVTYTQTAVSQSSSTNSGAGGSDGRSDGLGCGSHDCNTNKVQASIPAVLAEATTFVPSSVLGSATINQTQDQTNTGSKTSNKKSEKGSVKAAHIGPTPTPTPTPSIIGRIFSFIGSLFHRLFR